MTEQERLQMRLLETMAWCAPRVDTNEPKLSLRSADLRPRADYDVDGVTLWIDRQVIDRVAEARVRLAKRIETPVLGGRLLLCYHDENNHNWAAAEASNGFFDGHDNPPWDTCVGSYEDALIAWVPRQLLDVAQAGMEIECLGMLDWADSAPRQEQRTIPAWLRDLAMAVRGRSPGH